MEAKIVIAGDVVISSKFNNDISPSIVDAELVRVISEADYSLVNFEAPVRTKYSKPIIKSGQNLSQSAFVIDALQSIGFKCFTLANNHFRDYGHDACENTLVLLQTKGLDRTGGGKNIKEASEILYKEFNGIRIALINVCEQEWSIATENRAGSNPVNALTQYYHIQEAKSNADFVIIIHHGGVEHYNLPSPEMKKLHRFFIDAGADALINHHQHCFSGYEVYKEKPIFYGLGNFLFDSKGKTNSPWNYGYMVELTLKAENKSIGFQLYPYEQCSGKFGVYDRIDRDNFWSEISELNSIIADDGCLVKRWNGFVSSNRSFYNPAMVPYSSRIFNKLYRMKLLPCFMSNYQLSYLYDVINCESHRVRFLEFLENKIYNE